MSVPLKNQLAGRFFNMGSTPTSSSALQTNRHGLSEPHAVAYVFYSRTNSCKEQRPPAIITPAPVSIQLDRRTTLGCTCTLDHGGRSQVHS